MSDNYESNPATETVATAEEVAEALRALSTTDYTRLTAAAAAICRRRSQRVQSRLEPQDLVQMAVVTALDPHGRRWQPEKVTILDFLYWAMRSIAFNETRKVRKNPERSESSLLPEGASAGDFFEIQPNEGGDAESQIIASEDAAAREAAIDRLRLELASSDPVLLAIFTLRLEGTTKVQTRQRLQLSDKDFWAADRRLTRKIEAFAAKLRQL